MKQMDFYFWEAENGYHTFDFDRVGRYGVRNFKIQFGLFLGSID